MALQIWLPLDGNLENKGLFNAEITNIGATIEDNGKIGKCYSFSGSNNYLIGTPNIFDNNTTYWSFACWFKPSVLKTQCLFSHRKRAVTTGITVFLMNDNTISIHDGGRWNFVPSTAYSIGEWNHITVTRNPSEKRVYLNGTLIDSTITDGTLTDADTSSFLIGAALTSNNNIGTYFNGLLNDIRIYDHCLSAAEVHEISQGLVQHFKLNEPNLNLMRGNSGPNKNSTLEWSPYPTNEWTVSVEPNDFGPMGYVIRSTCIAEPTKSGGMQKRYDNTVLENGETYTGSCWARASKTCSVSFKNEWTATENIITLTPEWKYYTWTDVIDTSRAYSTEHFYVRSPELGMWIEQCCLKVEKGTKATAWSPHPADEIYDIFGYPHKENLLRTTPKKYDSAAYMAYQLDLTENLVEGQTYTLQLWDVNVTNSGKAASALGIGIYWGGGYVNLALFAGAGSFTNGHADYLSKTFTITNEQATGTNTSNAWLNIYNSPSDVSGTKSMYIGRWKIEKSSIPTGYTESVADGGTSNNIVYDSSGYGRNGYYYAEAALPEVTTDSPRYDTCLYFPEKKSCINCGRSAMVTDSLTVNLWVNPSTWGVPASCTESGGWNFQTDNIQFIVYVNEVGYLKPTSGVSALTLTDTWHMLTGVYDRIGQKAKIYIDGVLKSEVNSESANLIRYRSTNAIFIGSEAGSSSDAPTNSGLIGKISDFRIYCTALSSEDIVDLYHTTMKIDNRGNIHPYKLNESNKISVQKTGIAKASQFSELKNLSKLKYDSKTYIEPDGSIWVRVFHHSNPAEKLFESTDDFDNSVYKDEDRWFNFEVGNIMTTWEILFKQKTTIDGNEVKYRWIQSVNPLLAEYADVDSADVTKITTNGYSTASAYGGLYKKNSSTYLSANNGKPANWFGAVGGWIAHNSGHPGWAGSYITTGYIDVYLRIDNQNISTTSATKITKNNQIIANEFIER